MLLALRRKMLVMLGKTKKIEENLKWDSRWSDQHFQLT